MSEGSLLNSIHQLYLRALLLTHKFCLGTYNLFTFLYLVFLVDISDWYVKSSFCMWVLYTIVTVLNFTRSWISITWHSLKISAECVRLGIFIISLSDIFWRMWIRDMCGDWPIWYYSNWCVVGWRSYRISLVWWSKYLWILFRRAMFLLSVLTVLSIWYFQLRYLSIMTPRSFSEFSSIVLLKFTLISNVCNLVSLWYVVTSMTLVCSALTAILFFGHQICTLLHFIVSKEGIK